MCIHTVGGEGRKPWGERCVGKNGSVGSVWEVTPIAATMMPLFIIDYSW